MPPMLVKKEMPKETKKGRTGLHAMPAVGKYMVLFRLVVGRGQAVPPRRPEAWQAPPAPCALQAMRRRTRPNDGMSAPGYCQDQMSAEAFNRPSAALMQQKCPGCRLSLPIAACRPGTDI